MVVLYNVDCVMFVVSGGIMSGLIFDDLCVVDFDWLCVDVVLMDECWVSGDYLCLNIWLVCECFLVNCVVVVWMVLFYVEMLELEELFVGLMEVIEVDLFIVVVVLGMGVDMYMVFLFFDSFDIVVVLEVYVLILLLVCLES